MDEFYRRSTVTGKSYDVFKTIKILNLQQNIFYMSKDVYPVDIKIGISDKDGKKCLIFYYIKDETKEVFDLWCKQKEVVFV